MYANDTIAAIATAAGRGGIGIVRLSGPGAVSVANQVFVADRLAGPPETHRLHHGHVLDGSGAIVDEALAAYMYAPHTYTGEDVVELHCHGSPIVLREVLERCLAGGARLAEPGEFTKRAFLNGRLDLVQAEAVAELIEARTESAARTGMRHLSGALSSELAGIRDLLIEVKARLEVMIDFSEEDVDVTPDLLLSFVDAVTDRVDRLLQSFRLGRLLREGLHLAIIGRPNVGKSSLLNALLGRDRAIVTPVAGTTRDVIAESVELLGIPVVLADTAGLRADPDEIEHLGIERARKAAAAADAVLLVLDRSEPLTEDDVTTLASTGTTPVLLVLNKSDLPLRLGLDDAPVLPAAEPVAVSARTGAGIQDLRDAIVRLAAGEDQIDTQLPLLTLSRHRDALLRVRESLALARQSLATGMPIDAIAVDIQSAVEHIGSITGEVTTEEVLDRIFREFCIGK